MPETAKEKLKQLTASGLEPVLTDAEIDGLLADNSLADAAGFIPGDELWTPTYDIAAAAAAGWLIKAARASGLTETDPSGAVTSRVFDNCRIMAATFKARRATAVAVRPPGA